LQKVEQKEKEEKKVGTQQVVPAKNYQSLSQFREQSPLPLSFITNQAYCLKEPGTTNQNIN
jgi:hypothetical protein